VVVRVQTNGGDFGLGEAPVTTAYYGETLETALSVLPQMAAVAELSAGGDPSRLEAIEKAIGRTVAGNFAAKAGISAAIHDLFGKMLGLPLWKLWGLDPRAPLSSFTIALDDVGEMRERVREAASFPILKIKVGTPDDEVVLRMIRDEAPEKRLRVDANTGWTARQAMEALPMLEDFRVELLEQPLHPDDLEGFRCLARRSRIPIVADESCRTAADIPGLAGAVGVVNIKLAKCGGLREAVRMVHVARAHGMEVMLGCMIESTLGIAAAVQIAPLVDYVDLDGAALLASDPFSGPGIEPDGRVRFSDEPGLGVSPRRDEIH
jgi:L-alanine-DL-glutamate epimerase-like enolase superfamily enzyme